MSSKRTKEEQAAYMREYRKRKKAGLIKPDGTLLDQDPMPGGVTAIRDGQYVTERHVGGALVLDEDIPEPRRTIRHEQGAYAKPSFLAAPNDDCAACSHDRQSWHLEGPCQAPKGRGKCKCPQFIADLGFQ